MMADLAEHYSIKPVFLRDIAKREDISEKYLSIIVIPLRSAGLIGSIRGAHGGYILAKPPQDISIQNIFDALGENIYPVHCLKSPGSCRRVKICPTRDVWSILGGKIRETLAAMSLADLVKARRGKAEKIIDEQ